MKLEDIGFYTLSDERAQNVSLTSPLKRCELIITGACNFKCPYCRGIRPDFNAYMPLSEIVSNIDKFATHNLDNIRFSGGEPTIYDEELLTCAVLYAKFKGIKRIAISTNGSADFEYYVRLINAGVNDFSISLDACCASYGDIMAGGIKGAWAKVVENIRRLAELTYVTVGIVATEGTMPQIKETIIFAASLGVADIRIISAAQQNSMLSLVSTMDENLINKFPILKYRFNNILNNRHVRGIRKTDTHKCPLVLDDMAVMGGHHFPCIIHMREQGNPIGTMDESIAMIRLKRQTWYETHDTHNDPICAKNCLDVCIDHNNKVEEFKNDYRKNGLHTL